MTACECCGGNCDSGELVRGVCSECREEKQDENLKMADIVRIVNSQSCLIGIGMESEVGKNG